MYLELHICFRYKALYAYISAYAYSVLIIRASFMTILINIRLRSLILSNLLASKDSDID